MPVKVVQKKPDQTSDSKPSGVPSDLTKVSTPVTNQPVATLKPD